MSAFVLVPLSLREANAFVLKHHRHSDPVRGCKFALGAATGDEIIGVALVGRPVARHLDDGWTLEVNRLCVLEGQRNACSFLYGGARRATFALGYRRLVTYTLASESGSSLRGAGWRVLGERRRRQGWDMPSRPRVKEYRPEQRLLWEVSA